MERQNRTLLVLKYLWEETDIEHPATIIHLPTATAPAECRDNFKFIVKFQ